MKKNALTAIDFYKSDHISQCPPGTTEIYSNFTARSAKHCNIPDFDDKIVFFGLQYFIKDFLINTWQKTFFDKPIDDVIKCYKRRMDCALGEGKVKISHIKALHKLQFLPLTIKALPEGSLVPIGVPMLTIVNTHPDFFWLTNYIETVMSSYLWKMSTVATIAFNFKKLLVKYAIKTGSSLESTAFQLHDFSFRGMSGLQDAAMSGAAHLTSFVGTDNVPAIDLVEDYYKIDKIAANTRGDDWSVWHILGASVPATEHSVMCMHGKENELGAFAYLIKYVYPTGIVSIVSDTWDYWKLLTLCRPHLSLDIKKRKGKVVIRPDSGDPVKIICGDNDPESSWAESIGTVELLTKQFGALRNKKNYLVLDSHIGVIYGDSITLAIANAILEGLEYKQFASENITFGVDSYSYQYVTRGTFSFAMKSTSGVVNQKRRDIFKNPKTDCGVKKSAKGLLRVELEDGDYVLYDEQTEDQEKKGELEVVYSNGILMHETDLLIIREKLNKKALLDLGENYYLRDKHMKKLDDYSIFDEMMEMLALQLAAQFDLNEEQQIKIENCLKRVFTDLKNL